MPAAEIIAIGTELLLGEMQDTNTRYLARNLRDLGVNIYRSTIIGDNPNRIADAIRESLSRAQIVITTGGLGPTVDDPTRAAVALAMGVELEYQPALWQQIEERFQRYGRAPSENNRRQAWIPSGALPVPNPVGTAPSFICETANACVISLPGVPREMEYLTQNVVLPYLRDRFQLTGTIQARVLHVAGVGESTIDDWIGDLETSPNPTVGLLAHPGQVDIRITAAASSLSEAEALIAEMEARVRARIPEGLYGSGDQTLEGVLVDALRGKQWQLALVEAGLNGLLRERLEHAGLPAGDLQSLDAPLEPDELRHAVAQLREQRGIACGLGVSLSTGPQQHNAHIVLITPRGVEETHRTYGGERALGAPWAANTALELLRRFLSADPQTERQP